MGFVAGILLGIVLTIGLTFILLFIAKALGFTLFLRNEWRDDCGYYRHPNYTAYQNPYGCYNCWYKTKYYDDHPIEKVKNPYKTDDTDGDDIDWDEALKDGGSNEEKQSE